MAFCIAAGVFIRLPLHSHPIRFHRAQRCRGKKVFWIQKEKSKLLSDLRL